MTRAALGILYFAVATTSWVVDARPQGVPLPDVPQVRGDSHLVQLTIRAVSDVHGRDAFSFNGQTVPR